MAKILNLKSLKASLLLAIICLTQVCYSQTDSLLFEGYYSAFDIDPLGNFYFLEHQDSLYKYSIETQENYYYSNQSLGEITSFNTYNPFKIIVSHNELSTLVVLDVTLREIARIYLPDLSIFSNPVAYAMDQDGTIWLYDDLNVELININQSAQILKRIPSLIQYLDEIPQIVDMQVNTNFIVLNNNHKELIVLDQFGSFIKTIQLNLTNGYQLYNRGILTFHETIQFTSLHEIPVVEEFGTNTAKQVKFFNKNIYQLREDGIHQLIQETTN